QGWGVGADAVEALTRLDDVDIVVNALVGAAGLRSTLAALEAGKRCALANKESLVAGGELVLAAAQRGGGELIPVDSEHSAILQCIGPRAADDVARVILTASGGPFRTLPRDALAGVTAGEALNHPTWDMGAKITVDSATLANKALEVIEAHFLYGLPYDRIDAVVHPTSIIHSFVEFVDGSVLAQMGEPTMELPILCALSWPERRDDARLRTFDPIRASPLVFEEVDLDRFPLFRIGVEAGRAGSSAPAVFNAANEVAVAAFLEGGVTFFEMAEIVEETVAALGGSEIQDFQSVQRVDRRAREMAGRLAGSPVMEEVE
ncbi:MAG: 1-deoxy-D-xylulose-5-phosphate reductoisomerase, partial [Gemmatimonadota bacterium]|nr:1-deoxy-D-xylulose-5-phosphate reductoisomerase [Gemmatimonadota bacterium]